MLPRTRKRAWELQNAPMRLQILPGSFWACPYPGAPERCRELHIVPKSSRTCPGAPERAPELQNVPGSFRSCPRIPNRARKLQIVPGSSRSRPSARNRAQEFQSAPGSSRTCPARSCQRLPGCDLRNFTRVALSSGCDIRIFTCVALSIGCDIRVFTCATRSNGCDICIFTCVMLSNGYYICIFTCVKLPKRLPKAVPILNKKIQFLNPYVFSSFTTMFQFLREKTIFLYVKLFKIRGDDCPRFRVWGNVHCYQGAVRLQHNTACGTTSSNLFRKAFRRLAASGHAR